MSVSPSSRSSGGRAKRAAATPTAAQAGSGAAEEAGMRVLADAVLATAGIAKD